MVSDVATKSNSSTHLSVVANPEPIIVFKSASAFPLAASEVIPEVFQPGILVVKPDDKTIPLSIGNPMVEPEVNALLELAWPE